MHRDFRRPTSREMGNGCSQKSIDQPVEKEVAPGSDERLGDGPEIAGASP